jgi:hypothetical protein
LIQSIAQVKCFREFGDAIQRVGPRQMIELSEEKQILASD